MTETNNPATVVDELLAACEPYRDLDRRPVLEAIADPQWGHASPTNDWRNGVLPAVADVWEELPTEARLVAYLLSAFCEASF